MHVAIIHVLYIYINCVRALARVCVCVCMCVYCVRERYNKVGTFNIPIRGVRLNRYETRIPTAYIMHLKVLNGFRDRLTERFQTSSIVCCTAHNRAYTYCMACVKINQLIYNI